MNLKLDDCLLAGEDGKPRPKKYQNSYMLFCKDERANVAKENPEATPIEVARILGQKWRDLTTGLCENTCIFDIICRLLDILFSRSCMIAFYVNVFVLLLESPLCTVQFVAPLYCLTPQCLPFTQL